MFQTTSNLKTLREALSESFPNISWECMPSTMARSSLPEMLSR